MLRSTIHSARSGQTGRPQKGEPTSPTARTRRSVWIAVAIAAGALVIAMTVMTIHAGRQPTPYGVPTATVGKYRVPLADFPDRPELSFWNAYKRLLGDPIWPEQAYGGQQYVVGYENYIVAMSTDPRAANSVWEFVPLSLGEQSLKRDRKTPESNATTAPIVAAYFDALFDDAQAQGQGELSTKEDFIQYFFGKPLRFQECSRGTCLQVFSRQVVTWPEVSTNPRDVQLWPLGKESQRP